MKTRIINPYNPQENPAFLPGDKVQDKRDTSKQIWRITSRTAYYDTEKMELRNVKNDKDILTVFSYMIIPYLKMVAISV